LVEILEDGNYFENTLRDYQMLEPMETKLRDFEIEWLKRSTEVETMELNRHDAKIKRLDFEIEASTLRFKGLMESDIEEFDTRIEKIQWTFNTALQRAYTNFQNNESVRLKNKWGSISSLIYFLKSILGFI